MKKVWEVINKIRGKNKRYIKPLFSIDNQKIIDRRVIANKFNEYFASIASNLNKAVEDDMGIPINDLPPFELYLKKSHSNSIFLEDCTTAEIEDIIKNFENDKASDIPIKIIKYCSKAMSPILEKLYNECMHQGAFPNILKIGKVSPIYKNSPG